MFTGLHAILNECEGFAAQSGTIGGYRQTIKECTSNSTSGAGTLRDLAEAGAGWIVADGTRAVELNHDSVEIADNVTIDGRDIDGDKLDFSIDGGELAAGSGNGESGNASDNIVLYNLALGDDIHAIAVVGSNIADVVQFQGTRYWLHHLSFNATETPIAGWISLDESIDMTSPPAGGLYGTVSWCNFSARNGGNGNELTWLTADGISDNAHETRLTGTHNRFKSTRQRHPNVNGPRFHGVNEFVQWQLFARGIGAAAVNGDDGHVLSQNSIGDGTDAPDTNGDEHFFRYNDAFGFADSDGDSMQNGADAPTERDAGSVDIFHDDAGGDIKYPYTLDSTTGLETALDNDAGRSTS